MQYNTFNYNKIVIWLHFRIVTRLSTKKRNRSKSGSVSLTLNLSIMKKLGKRFISHRYDRRTLARFRTWGIGQELVV